MLVFLQMNYILCHKDIPVLRFSTEDKEISDISENPYIEKERAELLHDILASRIKETETLLH